MTFTVTLSAATSQAVTVDFATANGTATAGSDYTAMSGTLTIPAAATSRTISVPIIPDTLDEANETFAVNLSGAVNATIADGQGIGTISDNDALPILTINDLVIGEGTGGTANAVFTVTLSPVSGRAVTVNYATANGSPAASSGSDYVAKSGTLTFAAGETTKTVSVVVNGDATDEVDETFYVNLSNVGSATIGDSRGIATITDDDPQSSSISIADASMLERNNGSRSLVFTLTLSAASGKSITVQYATANGTATVLGLDYAAASGTVTFSPGVTSRTISVTVFGDRLVEPNQTFFVNLSNPVNATLTNTQAIGTILNDD